MSTWSRRAGSAARDVTSTWSTYAVRAAGSDEDTGRWSRSSCWPWSTPTDAAGGTEQYQVPLAYYAEAQERLAHALVGTWQDDELGEVHAYDAMHDRYATTLCSRRSTRRQPVRGTERSALVFAPAPGHDLDLEHPLDLFSGEQSNSSMAFGEDALMKVFRKVNPGRNPDIVIHGALTKRESEHVAALYGWLELVPTDSYEEPVAARDAPAVPAHRSRLGAGDRERPRPVRRGRPACCRGGWRQPSGPPRPHGDPLFPEAPVPPENADPAPSDPPRPHGDPADGLPG